MSISFAGLLIPQSLVLNQYGFALFLGVAFDTFIIRTVLMPAIVAAFHDRTDVFWFPTTMPPVLLSPEEEEKALWQGAWSPADYRKDDRVEGERKNSAVPEF